MTIWIILLALVLACALYISTPLLGAPGRIDRSAELRAYSDEIMALQNRDLSDAQKARLVDLQRRVLAITDANDKGETDTGKMTGMIAAVFAGLIVFSAGLYAYIGSPQQAVSGGAPLAMSDAAMPDDAQLEQQMLSLMEAQPDNADARIIYARFLMNMGRFDESLASYQAALNIGETPERLAEYDSAQAFVAQARAAQSMSPDDRMDMISGMVDSLAARLADEPDNPEGWVRLLTSRRVLGQTEQLATDMETMRAFYSERPDIRDAISEQSAPQ